MGDVQFDEQASYQMKAPVHSGLVGFLIKSGIAKDSVSAHGILLVAAACSIIAALFIFSSAQQATEILPAPPPAGFSE
jgi:hypothetical protein